MRKAIDRSVVTLCAAATVFILAMLAIILGNIIAHGTARLSWEFLSQPPTNGMTEGGIFPAIYGTVLLVLLMSIAAVPFGVIVAIYFAEYAKRESRFYRWTRMAVNNLAGVPSIVFGLFGLGFFIHGIGRALDKGLYGGQLLLGQPSIIWAAMTMAVLTLPVVIITVEETMRAVPREYREASLALGATRLQTILRVVLPSAVAPVKSPPCCLPGQRTFCHGSRLELTTNSCSWATTSMFSRRNPPTWKPPSRCCMRPYWSFCY
jgi:phosphate transport system permease protein